MMLKIKINNKTPLCNSRMIKSTHSRRPHHYLKQALLKKVPSCWLSRYLKNLSSIKTVYFPQTQSSKTQSTRKIVAGILMMRYQRKVRTISYEIISTHRLRTLLNMKNLKLYLRILPIRDPLLNPHKKSFIKFRLSLRESTLSDKGS